MYERGVRSSSDTYRQPAIHSANASDNSSGELIRRGTRNVTAMAPSTVPPARYSPLERTGPENGAAQI